MAKKSVTLALVEEWAKEAGVKAWELAALRRAAGWLAGKHVTQDDFDDALTRLRARTVGGGRI
ncbi:MAG: hypothetical protein PWQ57_909 [Desulfovibrionales bacterium]|jgi:hypothetical protein|nr:hypothetical protein [Desulfovibrionales bacterium]